MSRQLFASRFLSPVLDGPESPQQNYDEERSLNLDSDGRPLVETAPAAHTRTVTEVRAESDDRHREDGALVAALGTVTKVHNEPPDSLAALATNTRVRGERADLFDPDEDRSRSGGAAAGPLGTQTNGIKSERSNYERSLDSTFAESEPDSIPGELRTEAPTLMPPGIILRG